MADGQGRIEALDRLRGLLVALMALDHANYFVAQTHTSGEYWGGPFPNYPNTAAFLIRLVTHPAAPGFFFLMGAGVALSAARRAEEGWPVGHTRRRLLLRGVLLIAAQVLVVNRAWELTPGGWGVGLYIGVLTALGAALLAAAWLLEVKTVFLLIAATVLPAATDLLTPQVSRWAHPFHPILRLMFVPGGTRALWVNYPLLPWLGLTILGMAFGRWLKSDPAGAQRRILWIGLGALGSFAGLRLANGFGNIRPRGGGWVGFFNVVKYPPSLTFVLLTMGVNLLVLRLMFLVKERAGRRWDPLVVYGSTPLFFYITHLFLYAGIGRLLAPRGTAFAPMLLYWLLGAALLYPLCRGYRRLKDRQSIRSPLGLL